MNVSTVKTVCITTLLAGCLGLLAAGCATTSGTEATGTVVENERTAALNKSIIFNNRGLAGDIEITDIKSTYIGDFLKVQVSLRSHARDTVPVQYSFAWFDGKGFEISSNQAWKPFIVYGKETRTIHGIAPDPHVKSFKLKLRDPD